MGTPEDPTLHQTLEERDRAGPGRRDANPAGAVTKEPAEPKFELGIKLIEELRCVQTELERHVRVYLEAGERLVRCSDLLETLRKPRLTGDEWLKLKRQLDRTRPLAGSDAIRQAPEELAHIAKDFDEEREKANDEMRAALDPTQGAGLKAIQNEVFTRVWNMSGHAGALTETCRDGAEAWLNRIGNALSRIFGRIDQQMEARQAATPGEARASSADREPGEPTTLNVGSEPVPPPEHQR